MQVHNFSPGPCSLFKDIIQTIQDELFNWNNTGISILELNHRSTEFKSLLMNTKHKLRLLINIPADYEILFIQGGATQFFSTIPLNFTNEKDTADYIVNGYWSCYALNEASKFCEVNIANINTYKDYTKCPSQSDLKLSLESKYVHYCDNETIHGCEFDYTPDVGNKPLICDMSSSFLTKKIDIRKYGMIYAGSHKNIGPAGMVLVIVKTKLLKKCSPNIPTMMNLKLLCDNNSMLNTPPIFPIYVAGLTFKKLLIEFNGVHEIEKNRDKKAHMVYDIIDNSNGFYTCNMMKQYRSKVNIPFTLSSDELELEFLRQAKEAGLIGLAGHHTEGHCRISLYNAVPIESVVILCRFMTNFKSQIF